MGSYERQDLIDDISAALRTADEEQLLEIHRKLYGDSALKQERDIIKAFKRFDDTLKQWRRRRKRGSCELPGNGRN